MSNRSMKHIKPGDTVFVVDQMSSYKKRNNIPPVTTTKTVTRVGRKYGYIHRHGRDAPFLLEDGTSGFGFDIYTSEAIYRAECMEHDERKRLAERIVGRFGHIVLLPLDAVKAIHAILDGAGLD